MHIYIHIYIYIYMYIILYNHLCTYTLNSAYLHNRATTSNDFRGAVVPLNYELLIFSQTWWEHLQEPPAFGGLATRVSGFAVFWINPQTNICITFLIAKDSWILTFDGKTQFFLTNKSSWTIRHRCCAPSFQDVERLCWTRCDGPETCAIYWIDRRNMFYTYNMYTIYFYTYIYIYTYTYTCTYADTYTYAYTYTDTHTYTYTQYVYALYVHCCL